jgi:hypothetical protein
MGYFKIIAIDKRTAAMTTKMWNVRNVNLNDGNFTWEITVVILENNDQKLRIMMPSLEQSCRSIRNSQLD